eukprot:SAG22_NODE_7648_length_720_cov_2.818035_1_plen_83_part_10
MEPGRLGTGFFGAAPDDDDGTADALAPIATCLNCGIGCFPPTEKHAKAWGIRLGGGSSAASSKPAAPGGAPVRGGGAAGGGGG